MDILLNKIPEARCNEDFTLLKGHLWYEGFNWNDLLEEKMVPPYSPSSNLDYKSVYEIDESV